MKAMHLFSGMLAVTGLVHLTARADLYTGTIPFENSSVDVEFTGSLTGSETLTVTTGSVDLELEASGGLYTSLTLANGSFDLADATVTLDQSGIPRTLQITGFGFDLQYSALTLTPAGAPDAYTLGGIIQVLANRGTLVEPSTGITFDFDADPELVEVDLLATSSVTILDGDPDDGLVDLTADLRFDSQQLVAYDIAGIISGTVDISSVNTLSLNGQLSVVPEPATAGLLVLGFAGLLLRRRR